MSSATGTASALGGTFASAVSDAVPSAAGPAVLVAAAGVGAAPVAVGTFASAVIDTAAAVGSTVVAAVTDTTVPFAVVAAALVCALTGVGMTATGLELFQHDVMRNVSGSAAVSPPCLMQTRKKTKKTHFPIVLTLEPKKPKSEKQAVLLFFVFGSGNLAREECAKTILVLLGPPFVFRFFAQAHDPKSETSLKKLKNKTRRETNKLLGN